MYWHDEQVWLRATQWQRDALASAQAERERRAARRRGVLRRLAAAFSHILSVLL